MAEKTSGLTRRKFLVRLGQIGGAAAVYQGMTTMGLIPLPEAHAKHRTTDILPPGSGAGKTVAILGAGVCGFTAAYELTRAGYQVTILEANHRMGGRSLTVRQGDSYSEEKGPTLTCEFEKTDSNGNAVYLNAGPGRIPQHHTMVLDYCRKWGVQLEPYIFACRTNLLQADEFNGGRPMEVRQMKHNLRGEISEMLAKSVRQDALDQVIPESEAQLLLNMLQKFGDLTEVNPAFRNTDLACRMLDTDSEQMEKALRYCGTPRAGYAEAPGILDGVLKPHVALNDILYSNLWNEELFNDMRYYWQTSLMQPTDGMDNLWKRASEQPVLGESGKTLADLVKLNAPVFGVWRQENNTVDVEYHEGGEERKENFDFVISTMSPSQFNQHVANNFSTEFKNALAESHTVDVASCKVGWQTKNRFWEEDDAIYGGISWTKHRISQIWYPSNSFHANIGVLTGAYNRGEPAEAFGMLSHEERLQEAVEGGEKLHPGFLNNIDYDKGLSIAWQKMKYFSGGWQHAPQDGLENVYKPLLKAQGTFYQAGDVMSYNGGWMIGSMQSAHYSLYQVNEQVMSSMPVFEKKAS